MRLTISTTGLGRGDAALAHECHKVDRIDSVVYFGDDFEREVAEITLDIDQALGIAYDLLYQAVDAGKITGWNVQHPDERPATTTFTAR